MCRNLNTRDLSLYLLEFKNGQLEIYKHEKGTQKYLFKQYCFRLAISLCFANLITSTGETFNLYVVEKEAKNILV